MSLVLAVAAACGASSDSSRGRSPSTTTTSSGSGQRLDLTLTGGVSARLGPAWGQNFCTETAAQAVLFCELAAADVNWHVYLHLHHYTGPGRYAAKGEPAGNGSTHVVEGISVASRDTDETFFPVRGTVVISRSGNNPTSGAVGALVAGGIDADLHDNAGGVDAHVSGTFSTSLIVQ